MVIGDLGMGLADHAEQRGLSHVGEAHQSHVRQQLQLQHHVVALAGQTGLGKAGHLPGGGGEMLVAPAAPATLAQHIGGVVGHILDDLAALGVTHQRTAGHADGQAFAVLAGLAAALPVHAVAGHIFALVAEVHQCGHIVVHLQDDGAAVAAVAAVRAARRDIFFPMERHRAVAAVAGPHGDPRLVDKSVRHAVYLAVSENLPIAPYCFILPEKPENVNRNPPANHLGAAISGQGVAQRQKVWYDTSACSGIEVVITADSKFLEAPAVSSAENVHRTGHCAGSDFTISYRSCVFFLHSSGAGTTLETYGELSERSKVRHSKSCYLPQKLNNY